MVSTRERNFWKRLTAAAEAGAVQPDLFREVEVAARRRYHLMLVVCRKARLLGGIIEPEVLEEVDDGMLERIRKALSARIGFLRREARGA